jgi:hypothetical protein
MKYDPTYAPMRREPYDLELEPCHVEHQDKMKNGEHEYTTYLVHSFEEMLNQDMINRYDDTVKVHY